MANPFLEEQLPINIKMGATYGDDYNVEITQTSSGQEYRRLVHPYAVRHYSISYIGKTTELWQRIISLYHRAYGMYAGFRVRAMDDFSTNGHTGVPTAMDQPLLLLSDGVYQLQKQYGTDAAPLAIGFPVRTIYKPVVNTTLVGINHVVTPNGWTVDTTTGQVHLAANKRISITGISRTGSAIITLGWQVGWQGFKVGESVYFSGVVGMAQINTLRGLITAVVSNTITVAIDATLFSPYISGGTLNTRPQAGEPVTAGCQFDIPFRFNARIDLSHAAIDVRDTSSIDIVELISL